MNRPDLHPFKQSRDADTQSIGQHLDSVDRRIGTACFDSGHIRPGEAALIGERFLIYAQNKTQLPDSGTELMLKGWGWGRGWHSPWSSDVI